MASSSAIQPREKHDVFISFRGADTRRTFTSHLHAALIRMKIDAYIDYELESGDEIGPALLKAIEESKIFVIIFSRDYASSPWCLDELVHIMDCKERYKRIVIPIFYNIDPATVRHQSQSYADAFAKHERRLVRKDKLVEWKGALKAAANLSGCHSTSNTVRDDSDLVDQVVKDILTKLNRESSSDLAELIGVESRIQQILLLLCIVPDDVRIRSVGIWGMGGIGKTTIAEVVFHGLASQFEACCFLANVREESSESRDQYHLRNKLYRKLLMDEKLTIETPTIRDTFVKRRLSRTKVLIVLDDVDHWMQLEFLFGGQVSFGSGSRIIITTRDMRPLEEMKVLRKGADHDVEIYKVEELNGDEARQLFHLNDTRDICSVADSEEFLIRVVRYAAGNPLAIKILCRSLFSRYNGKKDLEDLWNELKKSPPKDLQNICRISYEALEDNEREIFLDIVCFHKNREIGVVKRELDACGLFSDSGIEILKNMSLISIKNERLWPHNVIQECLWIHDVIQEFGWDIVRKECPEEPGKRTRLHTLEDISHVLEKATGTATVKSICLGKWPNIKRRTHPQAFTKMYNLIFLKVYDESRAHRFNFLYASTDYAGKVAKMKYYLNHESFPDSLRYLDWKGYPFKSLPSQYSPKNLVELHMPFSKLQRLWNEGQNPENLKRIDLSSSTELVEIPDLSKSENIEFIDLQGCENLVQVPSTIWSLNKLVELNFQGCWAFENFPRNSWKLESLTSLKLGGIRLVNMPTSICKMKLLKELDLSCCWSLDYFPEISEPMEHLEVLRLCFTGIKQLPESIGNLVGLKSLDLWECRSLESIPPLVQCSELTSLDITYCERLQSLPEVPLLLEKLDAHGCTTLKTVSFSMTAITQGSDQIDRSFQADCVREEEHNFLNCLDLDENARCNIMNDARLRIMRMAAAVSKSKDINRELIMDKDCPIRVICPGNEIPKWCSYQTEGSSINIDLPPNWYDENFLGFALCAVGTIVSTGLTLYCRYNFKFNNAQCQQYQVILSSPGRRPGQSMDALSLDNVFVCYRPFIFNDTERFNIASFEFFGQGDYYEMFNVKRCGVGLLYAQDQDSVGVKTKRPKRKTQTPGYLWYPMVSLLLLLLINFLFV